MSNNIEKSEIEQIGRYPKFLGLRLVAWIEMLIFFCLMFAIAFIFRIPFNYFSVSPHPFWIIVILMAAQYGTNEGLVAAIISTCVLLLGPLPTQDILQDRFQYFFILVKTPLLWFIAAVIFGELRKRQIRERDHLKKAALDAEEKAETINKAYDSLKNVKEHMERRLASEMQTALMAYQAFKKLELLNKVDIIKGALDLTKALVAPEKCSIFLLEDNLLKCIAMDGWNEEDPFSVRFGADSSLFQEVIGKDRVVSIINPNDRNALGKEGIVAAPILVPDEHKVLGMIKIESIPFLQLRLSTIESLRSIGEWVGTAYASYLAKQAAEEGQFVSGKSELLTMSFYQYEKEFLVNLGKRLKINITLINITLDDAEAHSLPEQLEIAKTFRRVIKENLRLTDQAFEYEEKGSEFAILLVNTSLENSNIVRHKIESALKKELNNQVHFTFRQTSLHEEK